MPSRRDASKGGAGVRKAVTRSAVAKPAAKASTPPPADLERLRIETPWEEAGAHTRPPSSST